MRNLVVTLALAALAASPACKGSRGPSDEAIDSYLGRTVGRTGLPRGEAAPPTTAPPTTAPAGDAGDAPPGADAPGLPPEVEATRVEIEVVSGTGLFDMDDGPGETDAYVELEYEGWRERTSVADGTLEPVWGDRFVIDVRRGGVLRVTLMDRDSLTSDEKMGVQSLVLQPIAPGATRELAVKFRGGDFGEITLRVTGSPQ
jgi:hypothetical protein